MKGCVATIILGIDVRAFGNKPFSITHITRKCGDMKKGKAIIVPGMDILTLMQRRLFATEKSQRQGEAQHRAMQLQQF